MYEAYISNLFEPSALRSVLVSEKKIFYLLRKYLMYINHAIDMFRMDGWNHRGCSDSHLTLSRAFSSSSRDFCRCSAVSSSSSSPSWSPSPSSSSSSLSLSRSALKLLGAAAKPAGSASFSSATASFSSAAAASAVPTEYTHRAD